MRTNNSLAVEAEYDARRLYLATAPVGIVELFEQMIQLIQYTTDNCITKEENANEQH